MNIIKATKNPTDDSVAGSNNSHFNDAAEGKSWFVLNKSFDSNSKAVLMMELAGDSTWQ